MYTNTKAFYTTAFKFLFKKSVWISIFAGSALFTFNHVLAAAYAGSPDDPAHTSSGNIIRIQTHLMSMGIDLAAVQSHLAMIPSVSSEPEIQAALDAAGIDAATRYSITGVDATANLRDIVDAIRAYVPAPAPFGDATAIQHILLERGIDLFFAQHSLAPITAASTEGQIRAALAAAGIDGATQASIDPTANPRGIVEAIRAYVPAPGGAAASATDAGTSSLTSIDGRAYEEVPAVGGAGAAGGASATGHNIEFWTAAAHGNTEKVLTLISANPALLNAVNQDGWTALHSAAAHGHLNMVKTLIQLGAALDVQDLAGQTPLMWTVIKGHEAIKEALVFAGAQNIADNYGRTPLS